MSTKSQVAKDRRNKFRQRRGTFKPFSDESTNDTTFVQNDMRKFWSQRMHGGSQVDRSAIPDGSRAYFDYKQHVAFRPPWREDNTTPRSIFHLSVIFPGVKFTGAGRQAALDKMRKLMLHETDPDMFFEVDRTRFDVLRLYMNATKTRFWFVHQDNYTLKASREYVDKLYAIVAWRKDTIQWDVEETLVPDSS